MTQNHWNALFNRLVETRPSPRRWRLAASAFMRVLPIAQLRHNQNAIALAEQFADGQASAHQLASARYLGRFNPVDIAWALLWSPEQDPISMMVRAINWATSVYQQTSSVSGLPRQPLPYTNPADSAWFEELADCLLEILGPESQTWPLDEEVLTWQGRTVEKMAQAIYQTRDFSTMPVLADALEEAGCTNESLLQHCRTASGHVRGCWVLDGILGKQ
ncbi:MAG: hypothetical protein U0840_28855 [Gemmataceae bacterium]